MGASQNSTDSVALGLDAGFDDAAIQSTNSGAGRGLQVEYRPAEGLVPYARNARTHSERQVAEIAGSIRAFGWTNPILVDGDNGVIAGHGRLLAARKLGMAEVPVIELAGLSKAEKRAYILADNKLALNAGWDEDLLGAEMADLQAMGVDLSMTGFTESEVGMLVDQFNAAEASSFADEAPAPPKVPFTRPGDVWVMGDHRLVCGDATRIEDLRLALDGKPAAMVFTDPPYNVAYEGKTVDRMTIANDDLGAGFGAFLEQACRNMLQVTTGGLYICMSCAELATLKTAFGKVGGHWSTFIIWAKTAFTLGRSDYQRQFEPILYGWAEGNRRFWCGARDQGDVWSYARPRANDLHPTMKPVALVERAIRNSSRSGDLVLDPFAGSGTTLMAAEATGRLAALVELDPAYCDVIVRRWQDGTGGKARRQADGTLFDEASAEAGEGT